MLIYLIAGEPSGDALGAKLMQALRLENPEIRFAGIGGRQMIEQGLTSLFPMADLSIMGLVEVLPKIPHIMGRINQTMADITAQKPVAVVTIDSWGFTGRVQAKLKKYHPTIARIHYVAPMVWAWKPQRAKKLAKVLDYLLTLLPFEPPYFEKEGLKSICTGHPVVESGAEKGDGAAFRQRHGLGERPILVVLPGSRRSETKFLLPLFSQIVAEIAPLIPDLQVVVPTVETVADQVREVAKGFAAPTLVLDDPAEKYDCFAAGQVALAASGTVALELAMAGLPGVVAYQVSPVSAFLARKLMGWNVKYVCLPNMVMDQFVYPEFIQEDCTKAKITPAVLALLKDQVLRQSKSQLAKAAMDLLGYGEASPSHRAARAVLDFVQNRKV